MILHSEGLQTERVDEHLIPAALAMFCQECSAPEVEDCTCEGPFADSDIPDPRDIPLFPGEPDYSVEDDFCGEMADIAQNAWERAYWGD